MSLSGLCAAHCVATALLLALAATAGGMLGAPIVHEVGLSLAMILGAVAAVAPGTARIEERLHALERKEFIRRERRSSVADETEYAFQHVLVRDVAYGQMPRAARAERHLLAAGWMESLGRSADHADMLAHHFSSAGELVAKWDVVMGLAPEHV